MSRFAPAKNLRCCAGMRLVQKTHKCYLWCPDDGVIFSMEVGKDRDAVHLSSVVASGISAKSLTEEAREIVYNWARDEALRVTSSRP